MEIDHKKLDRTFFVLETFFDTQGWFTTFYELGIHFQVMRRSMPSRWERRSFATAYRWLPLQVTSI
jgi:hypothetical protein